jgi:hypothetical protein
LRSGNKTLGEDRGRSGRSGQSEATPMKIHIPGRSRVSPVGNSGGSGLVSSPSGLAGRPRQPGMNREASVSPSGHFSRAAEWISAAAAEVAMVMDRCKRRRNRLKSALGWRRVSQSEDLLRCRFSLSRTAPVEIEASPKRLGFFVGRGAAIGNNILDIGHHAEAR